MYLQLIGFVNTNSSFPHTHTFAPVLFMPLNDVHSIMYKGDR